MLRCWPVSVSGVTKASLEIEAVVSSKPLLTEATEKVGIEGPATCPQGTCSFRGQASTPDDAVELAQWLLLAATKLSGARHDGSNQLAFTEPDLASSTFGPIWAWLSYASAWT